MRKIHEQNRLAWNEAALKYREAIEKSCELLKSGGSSLLKPELDFLAKVQIQRGRCIHLQCAGGTDTLSFLNAGFKEVIGVDIAEEMITVAEEKTKKLGVNAKWFACDVLETPETLNETADLVYTGQGAINWIMDISLWAKVVFRLLKPGGIFFIFEGHPITYMFDTTANKLTLDPAYKGYFSKEPYESQDWTEAYVGKIKDNVREQQRKYERAWPLGEVVNSLIQAGLVLKELKEYPDKYWEEFPHLSDEERTRIPNTFSMTAVRPLK